MAPSDVVLAAARAGVELLALTDHDSVDGVEEAFEATGTHAISVVPAAEITTLDDGRDLHILGYRIDPRDKSLIAHLRASREDRERRAEAMETALRELGFELEGELLRARRVEGKSIGRPHLAEAVVAHPANSARLETEKCNEPSEFLERYLIEGRPAFRSRAAPSVPEAIEWIHSSGGVAVWAHPFFDIGSPRAVIEAIDRFRSAGLDGVECFYPTHDRSQVELLTDYCAARGLLITGSADFHGPEHKRFSQFRAFETFGREPVLGPIADPP